MLYGISEDPLYFKVNDEGQIIAFYEDNLIKKGIREYVRDFISPKMRGNDHENRRKKSRRQYL